MLDEMMSIVEYIIACLGNSTAQANPIIIGLDPGRLAQELIRTVKEEVVKELGLLLPRYPGGKFFSIVNRVGGKQYYFKNAHKGRKMM